MSHQIEFRSPHIRIEITHSENNFIELSSSLVLELVEHLEALPDIMDILDFSFSQITERPQEYDCLFLVKGKRVWRQRLFFNVTNSPDMTFDNIRLRWRLLEANEIQLIRNLCIRLVEELDVLRIFCHWTQEETDNWDDELKHELEAWQALSDEALANFEESL